MIDPTEEAESLLRERLHFYREKGYFPEEKYAIPVIERIIGNADMTKVYGELYAKLLFQYHRRFVLFAIISVGVILHAEQIGKAAIEVEQQMVAKARELAQLLDQWASVYPRLDDPRDQKVTQNLVMAEMLDAFAELNGPENIEPLTVLLHEIEGLKAPVHPALPEAFMLTDESISIVLNTLLGRERYNAEQIKKRRQKERWVRKGSVSEVWKQNAAMLSETAKAELDPSFVRRLRPRVEAMLKKGKNRP